MHLQRRRGLSPPSIGDEMTSEHRNAALTWRKSAASGPNGNCVELAVLADGGVAVRNSRCPGGPHLTYTRAEIVAFVRGVQAGEFDDLLP